MHTPHRYRTTLVWDGNQGAGTAHYAGYGRGYRLLVDGKPPWAGSADPAFRGDPALHNPEDLLLGAIASCHMLSYLALCARAGVVVRSYEDRADAVMELDADGGGRFTSVTLRPAVRLAAGSDIEKARRLHDEAHAKCFIANSCSVSISHMPEFVVDNEDPR